MFFMLPLGVAPTSAETAALVTAALYPAITTVLPIVVTIGLIFWVFRKVWKAKR